MSAPRSPRMLRGALVGFDLLNPVPRVIAFQYNPDTLTRTIKPRAPGGEGAKAEAMRLGGAPEETIKLDVELDATDALEKGGGASGLYPQLSALEMLVYPASAQVILNTGLLLAGTIEIVPPASQLTLLVWGAKRILPVRISELSITEDAHDTALNPVRAKVSLGLRVLSYNDLPVTNPAYHVFLAHQVTKEALAVAGSVGDIAAIAGGDVKLL